MKPIRISLAPVTAVVGLALIGNGVAGSLGAGVALVGVVIVGFLVALVLVDDETTNVGRRRTKKTLRHRGLLAADVRSRGRAAKSLGTSGARRLSGISYNVGINDESEPRTSR